MEKLSPISYGWHHFIDLSAVDKSLASLSCIFQDLVHLEAFIFLSICGLLLGCCLENHFFFVFLELCWVLFGHPSAIQLWQAHVLFLISKIRDIPFFPFFIPIRIVNDVINLLLSHDHVQDGTELLYFFLLLTNGVKKLLLFVFMLVLYVLQLLQIDYIFVFDLFESNFHLVYLLIERFVVFLDT